MAANFELQLVSKIIETQDFDTVARLGITEDFFLMPETREVFRFINNHFHEAVTYRSVPSWQFITNRFRAFPWTSSADTLASLCEYVRQARLRVQLLGYAERLAQQVDYSPRDALGILKEAAATLSAQHESSNDHYLSTSYESLRQEYDQVAACQGVTGLPWPWECLNEDTRGMHPGDFIVLYGRPKSMKTWVALNVAMFCYVNANARVLIWSGEMKPLQVMRRCSALISRVDYKKLCTARLNPHDHVRFFGNLQYLEQEELSHYDQRNGHMPSLKVIGRTRDKESGGVTQLEAKIREFKPDLVVVDGMYLMRDDRQKVRTIDWKAIAHISQDLKQLADVSNIPIIGVTQANRQANKNAKEADMGELAYADALGQDCTLAMRVTKKKDQSTREPEIHISLPGSREGNLDGFIIHGIPATNFGYKRALINEDAEQQGPTTGPNAAVGPMTSPSMVGPVPNIMGRFGNR